VCDDRLLAHDARGAAFGLLRGWIGAGSIVDPAALSDGDGEWIQ
jgi:hypothetical protein